MLIENNSFLQTQFWADIKSQEGWSYFLLEEIFVLTKKIKNSATLAYIPYGYNRNEYSDSHLEELSLKIKKIVGKTLFCIRWDLPIYKEFSIEAGIDTAFNFKIGKPFVKGFSDVQPPDTVFIDLKFSEDALLENMHKKTRYNIKLAEKKGVVVKLENDSVIDDWYKMYETTATRDKISIHHKNYYKSILSSSAKLEDKDCSPHFRIYCAYHEGDLLAGIIVSFYKDRAVYVYGASSNIKRNLMPAYLLQWQAMLDAKKNGCLNYDMFGISPTKDQNHPMFGLYRFKTGFGGKLIHKSGTYDYPVKKFLYIIFKLMEIVRYIYYKKLKKR